ncbi:kinase-like domain-containing protein [Aspergillus carlsbadensis]|nr:kinase-like domain-containing protein [Aspergillus carlsbadensis]
MTLIESPLLHLNESVQEINETSWLIANTLLLTRSPSPLPGKSSINQPCWSDSHGGHFALSAAPDPLPPSKPLAEDSTSISRVHAVDNQAAVWRAGEAFIKAHHMDYPDVTREHVTLQFLKGQQPQGFQFPEVYHNFEIRSRYFLIVSRVPGQLLEDAWPTMDERLREYYIAKVADVCNHLAEWSGDSISGVDGRQLLERYLIKGNGKAADALSPQQLLENCTEMSMDVSTLVFCHCDLGPTNLLVDTETLSLGIIDWELAGYVPIEWVRTKFRLSAGMDFNYEDEDSKKDWRRRVAQHLEQMGYRDVVDAWWKFHAS